MNFILFICFLLLKLNVTILPDRALDPTSVAESDSIIWALLVLNLMLLLTFSSFGSETGHFDGRRLFTLVIIPIIMDIGKGQLICSDAYLNGQSRCAYKSFFGPVLQVNRKQASSHFRMFEPPKIAQRHHQPSVISYSLSW